MDVQGGFDTNWCRTKHQSCSSYPLRSCNMLVFVDQLPIERRDNFSFVSMLFGLTKFTPFELHRVLVLSVLACLVY